MMYSEYAISVFILMLFGVSTVAMSVTTEALDYYLTMENGQALVTKIYSKIYYFRYAHSISASSFFLENHFKEGIMLYNVFGGDEPDNLYDICLTSTKDLLAVGYTESYASDGKRDGLIVKFDKDLNIILNKTVSMGYDETLLRLQQHDNYMFAIGWIEKPTGFSGMVLRVNLDFSDVRIETFEDSMFFDMDVVGGKLIVAGATGYNGGNIDMQLIVMDENLNILDVWRRGNGEHNETIHSKHVKTI